jgi:thioredoxin reductase (NADPH)
MQDIETLDCLIVGGGAAGLIAAVYLGRYRRRVAVIDEGRSRLTWIPKTRNVLGFPEGIEGTELLERMRLHAQNYGARLEIGKVESLVRSDDGVFEAQAGSLRLRARFVILATGARDVEPDVTGLAESLKAGHVRYCPVCDGFETQGRRVAVLGREVHGLRESAFVAGFDNEVTWLSMDSHGQCAQGDLARLQERGVKIVEHHPRHIVCRPDAGISVEMHNGEILEFDVLYPALGLTHASELATRMGAQAQEDGQLVVDDHYQTTVPGLYAAGDVAAGLNQINVAAGQAAIASTAIHNQL